MSLVVNQDCLPEHSLFWYIAFLLHFDNNTAFYQIYEEPESDEHEGRPKNDSFVRETLIGAVA